MFGGMEPDEVKTYQVLCNGSVGNTYTIQINMEIPKDTVVDGQVLCSVSGVVVRGSFEDYPKDEFSGFMIGDYTKNGPHVAEITGEFSQILYVSAFTYSDQGVFNKTAAQRSVALDSSYYIYGYDLVNSDEEPTTRVSYPTDVHNFGWTPASLNDLGKNWGSIEPGTKFMPRPCMLKRDGTVGEYLNPNNYKETVDGLASNVTNSNYDGDAMMQWPKIYTKRWEENGVYHFRCSNVKIDKDYECWCNYHGQSETPSDNFYTGIYLSSFNDSKSGAVANRSRSLSGLSAGIEHRSGIYDYIRPDSNNNWFCEHVTEHLLILDLLTMMGCTTNLRTVYGCTGTIPSKYTGSRLTSGAFDARGLFYGNESFSKVFGMEYYFTLDGTPRYIGGLSIKDDSGWRILVTPLTASNTEKIVYHGIDGLKSGSYISKMSCNSFGRLPYYSDNQASLTTYECSTTSYRMGYESYKTIGYIAYSYGFSGCDSNFNGPFRISYRPSPEI